jgi:hypothetical protein
MATNAQIELIGNISRLAAQVSMQGKYHVMFRYSGHVGLVDVDVHPSDNDYDPEKTRYVDGFEAMSNWIILSSEDGKLLELMKKLSDLLEKDADGIPL